MRLPSVALKYANAFLKLADNQDEAEGLLQQLTLWTIILNHPPIKAFFASPQFRQENKRQVLEKVFQQQQVKPPLGSSMLILLKKKRLFLLSEIVEAFKKVIYKKYGITQAKLVTATPLAPTIKEQLLQKLSSLYQKPIRLDTEVNPQLIGGGTLSIDSKTIDFSIRSKIKELKKDLLSIEVEKSQ
ncbi:MAG: ATP synthase F1 subunit delta [Parachlamydiaceae bacterium]